MAISVLFTADEDNMLWATKINKELHDKYPQGFRFDDSHLSHVTILQAYVDISCLDDKWDDIEKEVKASRLLGEKIEISGVKAEALPSPSPLSLVNLNLSTSGKALSLQKKILDLLAPCRVETETPKAFSGLIAPGDFIIQYVKDYPAQKTKNFYRPHMTLGLAKTADSEKIAAAAVPLSHMTVKRIGVFKLGASGTARERLFSFDK